MIRCILAQQHQHGEYPHLLAIETFSPILELARDPHHPSNMCSAALVCRTWRDIAPRTLFQDIVIAL